MKNLTVSTVASLLLLAELMTTAAPAQAARPCSGGEKSHQFDFWIGEWDVTENGRTAGANSIQPILDGCVLQEKWAGAGGSQGSSFNFYNPQTGKWRQFWVWRNGTTLDLEGQFQDGKMILQGESVTPKGEKRLNRITWQANSDGSVRQLWETSSDGGTNWEKAFDGLYTRKAAAEKSPDR